MEVTTVSEIDSSIKRIMQNVGDEYSKVYQPDPDITIHDLMRFRRREQVAFRLRAVAIVLVAALAVTLGIALRPGAAKTIAPAGRPLGASSTPHGSSPSRTIESRMIERHILRLRVEVARLQARMAAEREQVRAARSASPKTSLRSEKRVLRQRVALRELEAKLAQLAKLEAELATRHP
jgi:hypothetical protein